MLTLLLAALIGVATAATGHDHRLRRRPARLLDRRAGRHAARAAAGPPSSSSTASAAPIPDMEPIATGALAPAGYVSLECDARGTGASGGQFGLDGPRENQDAQDLYTWLAARPEVSDTEIGALGISLGGGAVWNATAAGVPFKAIVPVITWTNLQTALAPQGVAKTELVALLAALTPASRWDPDLLAASADARAGDGHAGCSRSGRGAAVAARAASVDLRADAARPGPPRLPLRHRPGGDGVQGARRSEGAVPRRRRPRAGAEPAGGDADVPRPRGQVVRQVPEGDAAAPGTGVQLAHDPWDGKTDVVRGAASDQDA